MYEISTSESQPHLCHTYPGRLGTGAKNALFDSCTQLTSDILCLCFECFNPEDVKDLLKTFNLQTLEIYILENALIENVRIQVEPVFSINVHFTPLILKNVNCIIIGKVKFTCQSWNVAVEK